jgi:hypothetical protein
MVTIRSEFRPPLPGGEPDLWANLGDILTWLDSLPAETDNRIAAAVSQEIRQMLFESVKGAEFRPASGAA